jgi:PRD1 phage membrane DNA delivery
MGAIGPGVVAIVAGIIGLAIVAVIVSKNAQTPQVFQGAGTALAQVIGAAVQPVSGGASNQFGGGGTTG